MKSFKEYLQEFKLDKDGNPIHPEPQQNYDKHYYNDMAHRLKNGAGNLWAVDKSYEQNTKRPGWEDRCSQIDQTKQHMDNLAFHIFTQNIDKAKEYFHHDLSDRSKDQFRKIHMHQIGMSQEHKDLFK